MPLGDLIQIFIEAFEPSDDIQKKLKRVKTPKELLPLIDEYVEGAEIRRAHVEREHNEQSHIFLNLKEKCEAMSSDASKTVSVGNMRTALMKLKIIKNKIDAIDRRINLLLMLKAKAESVAEERLPIEPLGEMLSDYILEKEDEEKVIEETMADLEKAESRVKYAYDDKTDLDTLVSEFNSMYDLKKAKKEKRPEEQDEREKMKENNLANTDES